MSKDIRKVDTRTMTDEEIDEYYRPQKSNKRKSLAPLYIYIILRESSDPDSHLSQQEIIDRLRDEYEIEIERKAVSRIIHTLSGEGIGIKNVAKDGVWFEPETI